MIGQKIYYFRKLKGLTQEQLAHGICSISHLSKIENGHETPSTDILEHLCKRLGISPCEVQSEEQTAYICKQLQDWYTLLTNRDKEESTGKYHELKELMNDLQEPRLILKFKILTVLYHLLLRNLTRAAKLLKELEGFKRNFDTELSYYFNLIQGAYFYHKHSYWDSILQFKKAEKLWTELNSTDPEIYYYLAQANMRLHRTFYSIKYAELASSLFVENYNYVRNIDCQRILGINHTRNQHFEKAEKHLLHALELSNLINNPALKGDSYHNLGYLYYSKGEYSNGITYYKNSLEYSSEESFERNIVTYYCLAKSYYELQDLEPAKKWVEKGYSVAKKHQSMEFIQHFKYLRCLISPKSETALEDTLKEEIIPFFEEKQNWYYVAQYAEVLAEHYSKQSKYKNSNRYYSLVNESRKNIYKHIN